MRRYWFVVGLLITVMLAVFIVAELLEPAVLQNPYAALRVDGVTAALVGVALLSADVVLPVPSSVIMFANGVLFGWVVGALVSTLGSLSAALLGCWLGRRGGPVLTRYLRSQERERASRLLSRWGVVAVIITRPVPILAEATVIMAGASGMRWRPLSGAALLGSVPTAILYAGAGATADRWNSPLVVGGLTLAVAAACWLVGRTRPTPGAARTPDSALCEGAVSEPVSLGDASPYDDTI